MNLLQTQGSVIELLCKGSVVMKSLNSMRGENILPLHLARGILCGMDVDQRVTAFAWDDAWTVTYSREGEVRP